MAMQVTEAQLPHSDSATQGNLPTPKFPNVSTTMKRMRAQLSGRPGDPERQVAEESGCIVVKWLRPPFE